MEIKNGKGKTGTSLCEVQCKTTVLQNTEIKTQVAVVVCVNHCVN